MKSFSLALFICSIAFAGDLVYVTNNIGDSVSVINSDTDTVISTLAPIDTPYGISFTQDSRL